MGKKSFGLIAAVMAVSAAQSVYAAELSVTPSHNSLSVNTFGTVTTVESIPAYLYNDSNYFMLRDIGKLTGFTVDWEDNKIYLIKDPTAQDFDSLSDIKKADTITKNKQTYVSGKTQYTDIDCLNIDGYNYFKLRDLEEAMDFDCDWDSQTNTVLLTLNNGKYTSDNAVTPYPSIEPYLDEELNQKTVDKKVTYKFASHNYDEIEQYIKENVDADFSLENYNVRDLGEGSAYNPISFRLKVGGISSNYGFTALCLNDELRLITFTNTYDSTSSKEILSTASVTNDYTDSELYEMAIKADGFSYKVDEQYIEKYYDVTERKVVYNVNTVYEDNGGTYFCTVHKF